MLLNAGAASLPLLPYVRAEQHIQRRGGRGGLRHRHAALYNGGIAGGRGPVRLAPGTPAGRVWTRAVQRHGQPARVRWGWRAGRICVEDGVACGKTLPTVNVMHSGILGV